MKRILSFLLALWATLSICAQHWTAPDEHSYPDETPVYAQVQVNHKVFADVEIAAFVDGECRAVCTPGDLQTLDGKTLFPLRVWGSEHDRGKAITFKAYKDGVTYKFAKTATFDGETDSRELPFILHLDLINQVALDVPTPLVLTGKLPISYDLGEKVNFDYQIYGSFYAPVGESEPDMEETTFTYEWSYSEETARYFTVDAGNVLHATENTLDEQSLSLTLKANGEAVAKWATSVIVRGEIVDVTGIKVGNPVLEVSYATPYDEIFGGTDGFEVKILPENATNKNWRAEPMSEGETAFEIYDGAPLATKPGTYSYKIFSEENPDFYTIVELCVVDDRRIEVTPKRLEIALGTPIEEVFGGPDGFMVKVLPETTPDKAWDFYLQLPIDDVPFDEDDDEHFVATNPGLYKYQIALVNSRDIYAEVELYIQKPVDFDTPREITLSRLHDTVVAFTNLTGDAFDPSKVEITFSLAPGNFTSVHAEGSGLEWKMRGLQVGSYTCYVSYDGVGKGYFPVYVPAEMEMESGWSWFAPTFVPQNSIGSISLYKSGKWADWMQQDDDNKVVEIRSQVGLLINDPYMSFFGDVEDLKMGYMYKVKIAGSPIYINVGLDAQFVNDEVAIGPKIEKGYNWIGFPYMGYRTIDELNELWDNSKFAEGDMILGKEGFAVYNTWDSIWVATEGFTIEEGNGYMFYSEELPKFSMFSWGDPVIQREVNVARNTASIRKKEDPHSVWQYDASLYPDNMAIVAQILGTLNTHNLTIGAFVGDECRGSGTFVKDDLLMINVAGKAGEKITFRLYDSHSGTYIQLPETLTHSLHAGSLKAPVLLTAPVETGLQDVKEASAHSQIYDLSGRRVQQMRKGIYIYKGRLIKN